MVLKKTRGSSTGQVVFWAVLVLVVATCATYLYRSWSDQREKAAESARQERLYQEESATLFQGINNAFNEKRVLGSDELTQLTSGLQKSLDALKSKWRGTATEEKYRYVDSLDTLYAGAMLPISDRSLVAEYSLSRTPEQQSNVDDVAKKAQDRLSALGAALESKQPVPQASPH